MILKSGNAKCWGRDIAAKYFISNLSNFPSIKSLLSVDIHFVSENAFESALWCPESFLLAEQTVSPAIVNWLVIVSQRRRSLLFHYCREPLGKIPPSTFNYCSSAARCRLLEALKLRQIVICLCSCLTLCSTAQHLTAINISPLTVKAKGRLRVLRLHFPHCLYECLQMCAHILHMHVECVFLFNLSPCVSPCVLFSGTSSRPPTKPFNMWRWIHCASQRPCPL